jgi:hypothetical protein|tara:strand:- start:63 stop:506 length:444 start_codon:yes stop_codon:yes gene_type:complete
MSTKQLQERFGASGLKGGKAEEWLFDKLNHVYDDVIDLREDWKSQIDGIDFGIKKDSWHNTYYLDSKGNLNDMIFYLELSKNSEPGWFWKSKSDRIYHVDVKNNRAAWYSLPEMRYAISRLGLPLDKELVKIKANDIIYKNIIKWMY